MCKLGSQALGDKIQGREGNSPDYQIRSQSCVSVEKDVELL